MEALCAFVTPFVQPLVDFCTKHLKYVVSSSNYVSDMHEKVKDLDEAVKDMKEHEMSNKIKNKMVPSSFPGWLKDVDDIKGKVEKIPTREVGCFNVKTKYMAGRNASKILQDIDRLMKKKAEMPMTNDIIVPLSKVSPPRASSSLEVHEDGQNKKKFKSRDLIFSKALKFLEPDNVKSQKMGICGMPGVGKTTMMEQLEKAAIDKSMFTDIAKVVVGQKPNPIDVLQKVAELTGGKLEETYVDTMGESLKKRFKDMSDSKKKILVILDDVWDVSELKHTGLTRPLPNGFKLLITSREETVCSGMGIEDSLILRMKPLDNLESKELFWETTKLNSDSISDFHQIGEDIINGCDGLPLAITVIAEALQNKNEYDWKNALSRLKKYRCDDHKINRFFMVSYENLKHNDHKEIFLLSGLFPDDYKVNKEELLWYAWGLKLFQEVHTITEARNRLNTCVDDLIRSNLLISSDREGCVKMHDLVRDFVLSNFSEVKQASIVVDNNYRNVSEQFNKKETYERILLEYRFGHEAPLDFDHPHLKLLMLMGRNTQIKFPEDFYEKMGKLEVVAYERLHKPCLPRHSTNLRVLYVQSFSLADDDISFLGDLINLEVLVLTNCYIRKLPSNIGNLKKLKLLNLRGSVAGLCIDDGVLHNLCSLEELYMGGCSLTGIRFTNDTCNELSMLLSKLDTLEVEFFKNQTQPKFVPSGKLERFRISMGCLFEEQTSGEVIITDDHKVYAFKNTLKLVTSSSELLECKINELFKNTEILHLEVNDMNHLKDVLTRPPQNCFCKLKDLEVYNCEGLTHLFTTSVVKGLTKLESLKIKSCPVLKSVISGASDEDEVIKFPKLKRVYLHELQELESFCDSFNVVALPVLEELHLIELQNVTSIFPNNYIDIVTRPSFFNDQVSTPKLQKLRIVSMENLKEIWPCEITSSEEEVNNSSMLREIDVFECNSLINLFPCNPMRLLGHLEKLVVSKCGSIEVLFNINLGNIKQLSNNTSLRIIKVSSSKMLTEVCRIKDVENSYDGLICDFQAVESICIDECERFRNIVTPTTMKFDIRALKEVIISDCGEGAIKNELAKNNQEQEINISSFSSHHITNNFHQLRRIILRKFQGVNVVFEIESSSNKDQPQPLLPYLEYLQFKNMETLTHVWKCNNWNEFFTLHKHQPQSSLQNLTSIYLSYCISLKYLFSPLMVELLSNLKNVDIRYCYGMEEVVSNRDIREMTTYTYAHTTTTSFPHLNILKLHFLHNLKNIGGGFSKGITNLTHGQSKVSQVDDVSWSLCQYSNEIDIHECDALSCVIPYYAAGQTQNLQILRIEQCSSMMEVFETKEINDNDTSGCGTTSVVIPRPRINTLHNLLNLKLLTIASCERLEYVFTFSTLQSLNKLEKLVVKNCKAMGVIVKEEQGEHTSEEVVFRHLKSIELDCLPILEGFFLGMNIEFQWPLHY